MAITLASTASGACDLAPGSAGATAAQSEGLYVVVVADGRQVAMSWLAVRCGRSAAVMAVDVA